MITNKANVVKVILVALMVIVISLFEASNINASTSNSCGSGVKWSLNNGLLTIYGNGDIANYTENNMAPWYENRSNIHNVVVEEGVRGIGDLAFYDCDNLNSVQLPESLISINDYAFADCEGLTAIYLGSNVISIGDYAFDTCESLLYIDLPNKLVSIGYHSFYRCESLVAVTIPASVQELGEGVFAFCTSLLQAEIKSTLDTLSTWAFYGCDSLVSVSLPSSIKTIDPYTFKNCDSLTNVYYGGVDEERDAFYQEIKDELPNVTDVKSPSVNGIEKSEFVETEKNSDGSVSEISKEVISSSNATVRQSIEKNTSAGKDDSDYQIILDATIKNDTGWQEVIDKVDEALKYQDIISKNNKTIDPIEVNVQTKDNVVVSANTLSNLAGKPVQLNIYAVNGDAWTIRCEDIDKDALSGEYNLRFTIERNENSTKKQKKLIGDAVSYLIKFEENIPFEVSIKARIGITYARQYASFCQKAPLSSWEIIQTTVVDDYGYATFNLSNIDTTTEYMVAINVEGIDTSDVLIPESMSDSYGGLTDAEGNRYEITGVRSAFGISFWQLTLIVIGVVVVSIVVVGIIVKMFAKAKYRDDVVAKSKGKEARKKSK